MATRDASTITGRYQPSPRFGHASSVVQNKLYVWAGWQRDFPEVHTSPKKTLLTSSVEVFGLGKGEWQQLETFGDPPLGVRGYACCSLGTNVYYFGGYCGHEMCRHNAVYYLDTLSLEWNELVATNPNRSPMRKNACGMVTFQDGKEDFLFIVGGSGLLCSANQPEAVYIPWRENPNFGWTNECNTFCITTRTWELLKVTGDRPPPCHSFTLTMIGRTKAVLFGGLEAQTNKCLKDIYIVDLTKDTVHWTKLPSSAEEDGPQPRSDHTAVCVGGPLLGQNQVAPFLFIVGGRDNHWNALGDCWLLNCLSGKWKQVELPSSVTQRHFQSLSTFPVCPHCIWLVVYGGVTKWIKESKANEQPMVSDTTVIELVEVEDEEWVASAVLDSSKLTDSEDYKCRLIQRLMHVTHDPGQAQPAGQTQEPGQQQQQTPCIVSSYQRQLDAAQETIHHLQQQLQQVKTQAGETRKADACTPTAGSVDSGGVTREESPQQQAKAVTPHRPAPRVPRAPITSPHESQVQIQSQLASATSRAVRAEELALETTHSAVESFIVQEGDLEMTGPELSKGSFGSVSVAQYKGYEVAAKRLYQKVSSEYSKMVIYREVLKMSWVRHPNLVQFYGTLVGSSVTIVFELMPSSVRRELEKKPFSKPDVASIAYEVTLALSHLHHFQPQPIIHRGVNSANVLLEPLQKRWRAKLSDFGSNNFIYYTADNPATNDPAYVAPEVTSAASSSPRLDVFSFGILLLEMACRHTPPTNPFDRDHLLEKLKWPKVTTLIQSCISTTPKERPDIQSVCQELQSVK